MKEYEEVPVYDKNGIICYTKIDKDDIIRIKNKRLHLQSGYAVSHHSRIHRFVLNAKKGDPSVDHINNDKLDNRKSNLRFVTGSQNSQNKTKQKNCSSNYIGVVLSRNLWYCHIRYNEKRYRFSFKDEKHAAYKYDTMALEYYGPKSNINGIEKPIDYIEPVKKEKSLPKGITLINDNIYRLIVCNKHVGTFKNLEEAESVNKKMREKIKSEKLEEKVGKEIVRNKDGIAVLKTSKGKEYMVDDDKYFDLKKYTWINNQDYAYAEINGKGTLLHRHLLKPKKGEIIDHINRNRQDNRLLNLRICSESLNAYNRAKQNGTSSKYYGVHFEKFSQKFRAEIIHNGKKYRLGRFKEELDAVKVYNIKATELYGLNANLNII